jgi:hypothetical protein
MRFPRWSIVATLLDKEWQRYRHNWGLLAVVIALVMLGALVSLSDRLNLAGRNAGRVDRLLVWHEKGSAWADHLRRSVSSDLGEVEFQPYGEGLPDLNLNDVPRGTMAVLLTEGDEATPEDGRIRRVEYQLRDTEQVGVQPFRDWVSQATRGYFRTRPSVEDSTRYYNDQGGLVTRSGRPNTIPLVITALVIFGLYLCSFNIFITSAGEEREKKITLALLLTPASALEYLAAKALFYVLASLVVAVSIVAMYRTSLLAVPMLWTTVALGSLAYVSIGTVALCLVRRQTTINTLSMLYLIATSVIMILSQVLPLFQVIRFFLVENWLYSQLEHVIAGRTSWGLFIQNQLILFVLVIGWASVAVLMFSTKGIQAKSVS